MNTLSDSPIPLPTLKIVAASVPVLPAEDDPAAELWYDSEGRLCVVAHVTPEGHWMHVLGVGSYRFSASDPCVWATPLDGVSEAKATDIFYRNVLPVVLQLKGQVILHANAVDTPAGVLGLCAASMTGKSTLAKALERRGHALWTDDNLAVDVCDSQVYAKFLPFILRLRPASAEHFGEPARRVPEVDYWSRLPAREPHPLAALVLLERYGAEEATAAPAAPVTLERLRPAAAYGEVLGHLHFFTLKDPEVKRAVAARLLGLLAHVPVFRLRFRAGFEHLPLIASTLEREVLGLEPALAP